MRRMRLAGVLACLSLLAVGCGDDPSADAGSDSTQPTGSSATGPLPGAGDAVDLETARIRGTRIPTGDTPVGLSIVADQPWVTLVGDNAIQPVVVGGEAVEVGSVPLRLQELDGDLWVSLFGDGRVARVDPEGGEVVESVRLGREPEGLAVAAGDLWVVDQAGGALLRVEQGTVTDRVPVGFGPRLAVDAELPDGSDGLWVGVYDEDRVVRVDPGDAGVAAAADVCAGPQGMALQGDVLWVACTLSGDLLGLDASTLEPVGQVVGLRAPDAVVAGREGTVLVAEQAGPAVVVVDVSDPAAPVPALRVAVDDLSGVKDTNVDVVTDPAGVWLSSPDRDEVVRIPWRELSAG